MITHGHARRKLRTRTYSIWTNMISRCYNKCKDSYIYYGAIGVTVCERWRGKNGFNNFLSDMGECSSPDHSIDRYPNPFGNYEVGNCRWATLVEQAANKRSNYEASVDNEPDEMTLSILKSWDVSESDSVPF